jgi:Lar family restriction alleviation protein
MSDLMPCPFCGCETVYVRSSITEIDVYCQDCTAVGPVYQVEEDAITAWNTRTVQALINREHVAFSMWKAEADRAAPNVGKNRTPEGFSSAAEQERDRWLMLADAAIGAIRKGDQP